jgi:AcrR family transcriptional regulator
MSSVDTDSGCCCATPAERRREKMREAIISAAQSIFSKDGEAGLSMRRLAEAIDYSPAALYKYFSSKDDLYEAVREQFFERLLARMNEATHGNGSTKARFEACGRSYIETALEEPDTYLMAYTGMGDDITPVEGTFAYAAAEQLESMISKGMDEGIIREVDLALAGKAVWAAVHGLATLLVQIPSMPGGVTHETNHTREDMIHFHTDFIWRGLAK